MLVTRGLVIDGHWVSLILAGRKTWEMRSQVTNVRGKIGLIRKGTGQVSGVVDIVDCGAPMSMEEMLDNMERHQIPESLVRSGEVRSWCIPWILERAVAFPDPVPYDHPSGAVKWVKFEESVSDQIEQRLRNGGLLPSQKEHSRPLRPKLVPSPARPLSDLLDPLPEVSSKPARPSIEPSQGGVIFGRTAITEGNLKNNHIYLRSFFDRFPSDAVGGANKSSVATTLLKVRWNGAQWQETDLDGQKLFFRSRSLVRKFFEDTGAVAGDVVEIERVDAYHYILQLRRA
jgi:hypothetical protein